MGEGIENPSAESIKKKVEDLFGIVDWAADIWRSKNWVRRLLLLDVLLLTFNPFFIKFIPGSFIPDHYDLYFWAVTGLFFVIALVIGIRAKAVRPAPTPPDRRSPIKGLLAFDTVDEEVFARLQRHNELLECAQAITDHNYRFGILSADSGNGKTSFLQAGLLPALRKRDHRCVYVKFAELDPVVSIRQALAGRLPPDTPPDATLSKLLRSAPRSEDKETGPLVLLLDQFEQFFVHQKRKKDREPFIRQLSEWYKGDSATPAKLLISIRRDFRGHLDEIHKTIGYSLGPQQIFNLERFTPEQAAEIFHILAESAQLEWDRGFIEEVTARELAASDDGLISPVDIQILAWMIARQSAGEDRAFTRSAFQKLGGVEGLLERFLTRALDARETTPRRQAATKALLALTDLERDTRAGALTLDDLRHKLGDAVPDSELKEAIEWLTRGDVRLAVPVKRDDIEGYELAHERLIPALRRIANKELTEADRANLLLDRRANEWQGSNRDKRYLFSWRELRLIGKQTPFLQWGQNRNVKQALLRASKRRLRFGFALVALPFLLAPTAALIWYSQWGKLQIIKWEVARSSESLADEEASIQVAMAYATMEEFSRAQGIAEKISSEYYKAFALVEIAKAMAEVGAKQHAIELLKRARGVAEKSSDEHYKASALIVIAKAIAEVGAKQRDEELLRQAQEVAEKISDEHYKASVLVGIAKAMAEIGAKQQAIELLRQAQVVAEKMSDESSLREFVKAVVEVGAKQQDEDLLGQAMGVAKEFSSEYYKPAALAEIAKTMAEIGAKQRDEELLRRAQGVAEKMSDERYKAFALVGIARVMAEVGSKRQAIELLKQAQGVAEKIRSEYSKASALGEIAKAMAEVGAKQRDEELLRQALRVAEKMSDERSKASALRVIAKAAAAKGDFRLARAVASKQVNKARELATLALILETWARSKDPRLADKI
jgi:tetratricopeptide (TPR) repeat protein